MTSPTPPTPEELNAVQDPAALLAAARQLRKQKKYAQSIARAEQALSLTESTALSPALIAELHLELGSSALSAGNWQQASEHLKLADTAELAPAGLYHRLGRASQELGQLETAAGYYQRSLAGNSGTGAGKTWYQLGRVRELLGETELAAEAFARAIESFGATGAGSELGVSAYQLGRLQQGRKAWAEAGEAFELARRHLAAAADLRAEACYALSEIALQNGEPETAKDRLAEAISIHKHLKNPARVGVCLLKLCQALMQQRQWKDVIKTVSEAIGVLEATHENAALKLAYELQGELLELLGKGEEAREWFDKAASLSEAT